MTDAAGPFRSVRRPRGWRSHVFDIMIALLATGAGVVEVRGSDDTPLSVYALTVVAGAALVLRRWVPLTVLATTVAAAIVIGVVAAGLGDPLEVSAASVLVALYTTASLCELRVSLAALVPTVVVVAVLSVATADVENRNTSALGSAVIAATLAVGVWGLGAYAQTRRRYQRQLEERTAQLERERDQLARIAVHEERASIARELHDIVAHSVSVMLVGVRGARAVLRTSPEQAEDALARVETSAEQSLAELRRVLTVLRSPAAAVESRPQPSLADLDGLVADFRAAGLPVRLRVVGGRRSLPGGVELSVYRIVEEALTNVLKHADPSAVTVALAFRGSSLEVEVVDDGAIRSDDPVRATGHGLVGMRERVAVLGGELETGHRAGGGFRMAARFPLDSRP